MSKTFKSATDNESELDVRANDCGVFIAFSRAGQIWQASTFARSDAPALALAILEAAGVEPDREPLECQVSLGTIVADLQGTIQYAEALASAAREQAELEAEALALLNASLASCDLGQVELFDALNPLEQQRWLAVARKAREIGAKK